MGAHLRYLLFALDVHKSSKDKGANSTSVALLEMGDCRAIKYTPSLSSQNPVSIDRRRFSNLDSGDRHSKAIAPFKFGITPSEPSPDSVAADCSSWTLHS